MRTNTGVRAAVAAAVIVMVVSGCGGAVAGSPAGPSYTAPDPATATAESVDLEDALAVSPDGTRLAIIEDDRLCVRDRVPTGAQETAATCAEEELDERLSAVFSPNGSRIVAFANVARSGPRGRAWIVDSGTGGTTPIALPTASSSTTGPSTTGSPTPGTSTTRGTDSQPDGPADAAVSYLWQSDDALLAVGITGAVYRVSPSTGDATLVAAGGDQDFVSAAALGGGTVAMVRVNASERRARLVTVSVTDGVVQDPAIEIDESVGRPTLLGVSPDGTKTLLSTADLQRLIPGETRIYDLVSTTSTTIPGTDRTYAVGGAFSPDGSLIALVASGTMGEDRSPPEAADGNRFHLQLAPADGSSAPRDLIGADDQASRIYGPLRWSGSWLVTGASPAPGAAAWTIDG